MPQLITRLPSTVVLIGGPSLIVVCVPFAGIQTATLFMWPTGGVACFTAVPSSMPQHRCGSPTIPMSVTS